MQKLKLGIIGWRGMVGQVLMGRLLEEEDLSHFETTFFSTSKAGVPHPFSSLKESNPLILDAKNISLLKNMDILLSCQGGDYTKEIYPALRKDGFKGYWVDAASALRMECESTIVLDPVNLQVIKDALKNGKKDFIGGNCTVSLMLLALGGLFAKNHIEWVSAMTYQAASGGGARHMLELLAQTQYITGKVLGPIESNFSYQLADKILDVEKNVTALMGSEGLPKEQFGMPLAFNLLPWIDVDLGNGMSKEEWKAGSEANKILMTNRHIPIEGTCVRISSMRCHAQGLVIKLNQDIPVDEIESILSSHNPWAQVIKNTREESLLKLTPQFASGKLDIPIGRIRKMAMGPTYINAFTVGDQLLWGAAEPLRRMLRLILEM